MIWVKKIKINFKIILLIESFEIIIKLKAFSTCEHFHYNDSSDWFDFLVYLWGWVYLTILIIYFIIKSKDIENVLHIINVNILIFIVGRSMDQNFFIFIRLLTFFGVFYTYLHYFSCIIHTYIIFNLQNQFFLSFILIDDFRLNLFFIVFKKVFEN